MSRRAGSWSSPVLSLFSPPALPQTVSAASSHVAATLDLAAPEIKAIPTVLLKATQLCICYGLTSESSGVVSAADTSRGQNTEPRGTSWPHGKVCQVSGIFLEEALLQLTCGFFHPVS